MWLGAIVLVACTTEMRHTTQLVFGWLGNVDWFRAIGVADRSLAAWSQILVLLAKRVPDNGHLDESTAVVTARTLAGLFD